MAEEKTSKGKPTDKRDDKNGEIKVFPLNPFTLAFAATAIVSIVLLVKRANLVERVWLVARNGLFNRHQESIVVWGTFWWATLVYGLFSSAFLLIDLAKTDMFKRYKTQAKEKQRQLTASVLFHTYLNVVFLNVVVGIPSCYVFHQLMIWRSGHQVISSHLPTIFELMGQFPVFVAVQQWLFYYIHRAFHHRAVYKHFHKVHHEWTAPVAIAAIYAHPLEHLAATVWPVLLGPILCGSHVTVTWFWLAMATFATCVDHSGYHFPFLRSPERHDFHHVYINQCYGSSDVIDWLHGTDDLYQISKQIKRDVVLMEFKPLRDTIPD